MAPTILLTNYYVAASVQLPSPVAGRLMPHWSSAAGMVPSAAPDVSLGSAD